MDGPADDLGARRRGEGAGVPRVTTPFGQQGVRIEIRERCGRLLNTGYGVPNGLNGRVRLAGIHEHTDHRKVALFGLMHEVNLHRKARSADRVLAGKVEVKLEQREPPTLQCDRAAALRVDLDRVPIVHYLTAGGLPVNLDLASTRRDRAR